LTLDGDCVCRRSRSHAIERLGDGEYPDAGEYLPVKGFGAGGIS